MSMLPCPRRVSISSWAAKEKWVGGIPMPNFTTSFGIKKEGMIFVSLYLSLCLS